MNRFELEIATQDRVPLDMTGAMIAAEREQVREDTILFDKVIQPLKECVELSQEFMDVQGVSFKYKGEKYRLSLNPYSFLYINRAKGWFLEGKGKQVWIGDYRIPFKGTPGESETSCQTLLDAVIQGITNIG
jgi:hypothetical protein